MKSLRGLVDPCCSSPRLESIRRQSAARLVVTAFHCHGAYFVVAQLRVVGGFCACEGHGVTSLVIPTVNLFRLYAISVT